jgi:hypothetical protein
VRWGFKGVDPAILVPAILYWERRESNVSVMLTPTEAIQQAEYSTNAVGQPVVQLSLSAWESIQSALHDADDEDDSLMLNLFLDFITAEALKSGDLQSYTQEMAATARQLVYGVEL